MFKRYEKKYLLDRDQYVAFREAIEPYMEVDAYGLSLIQNIYYDTPDFRLIRASIDKPLYKEKLRVRTYGECDDEHNSFVEIKKKFNGVVYKRRIDMTYAQAMAYTKDGAPPPKESQISREIDWFFKFYHPLAPAMYISYERVAMASKGDGGTLRLTFDRNITYRTYDLDLRKGSYGDKILDPDTFLLEIKIPGTMPLWMVRILEELDLHPVSISKYGTAYKTLFEKKLITIGGTDHATETA